jgi:sucrose-6F-phosphate phosphohydrolase
MTQRLMLATDLDGTILGDGAALERFCRRLREDRAAVTLVYATGRTVVDVQRLVQCDELPAPDHVIGSVGTEIIAFDRCRPADEWAARVCRGWSAESIREALEAIPELELQPAEHQSAFKVSYFLEHATSKQIRRIGAQLATLQLPADVIYSGKRFVDVLPRGMNKGTAVEFLAERLEFRKNEVIACGDSANDLSMCERGFRAVLVGNADEDLIRNARHPRYHSPFAHATGVLDGVDYWTSCRRDPMPGAQSCRLAK